ncbi:MAG TPA: M1 family peptidase [bacterium (Candidatus Stahlbacteria)]|nr:M1 family peptidase [Candidatus Stahlbacteria bacterium]
MIILFMFMIGKGIVNPEVLAESTHTYDALHYYIRLDLPMDARYLDGWVTVAAKSEIANLDSVTLDLYGFAVDSVFVDGQQANFAHPIGVINIELPVPQQAGDSFDIDVFYHGYGTGSSYSGLVYFGQGGNVLHPICYTMAEPYDARYWLPCFDEPWDKAEYGCDLEISVPDSFTVAGNGTLVDVGRSDGRLTFHWRETYPISTYLIHFGASIFVRVPIYYNTLLIDNYVWPEDSLTAAQSFAKVPGMFDFFIPLYGPYPFDIEKYGHDVVYPCGFGGMEHQTLTTLSRNYISSEWVIAHELAHQWWGDMITCIDWRDIWLNEGFATYSDAMYLGHINGHQAFIDRMLERAAIYFEEDSVNHRPIYDPPMNELFNYAYTYCKASWVMHMLRYLGGDSLFFQGLRDYGDSLDYGNGSTYDLNRIMSQVYGTDLTWFFDEWIFSPGHPEYQVNWGVYQQGSQYLTKIRIEQTQTNSPIFLMPVEVRLDFASGDTTVRFPIQGQIDSFEVVTAQQPTNLEFDPNEWILHLENVQIGVAEEKSRKITQLSVSTICRGEVRLSVGDDAWIEIFDSAGRRIDRRFFLKGDHRYHPQFSSGIYFMRTETSRVVKFIYLDRVSHFH